MRSFSVQRIRRKLLSACRTRLAKIAGIVFCCFAVFVTSDEVIKSLSGAVEVAASSDLLLRQTAMLRGWLGGTIPVAIVDIDDATMAGWQAEAITPRPRLADLIKLLSAMPAAAIVLDIDLTDASDRGQSITDPVLEAAIRSFPATGPRLLLVHPTLHTPREAETCGSDRDVADCPAAFPSSPYGEAVAQNPAVDWVTASFLPDDDGFIRRWRLWEVSCVTAPGEALPSAALFVAAMRASPGAPETKFRPLLDGEIGRHCNGAGGKTPVWPDNAARFANVPYVIGGGDTTRSDTLVPFAGGRRDVSDPARSGFSFVRIPASILDSGAISPSIFAGRIVLIGSTHRWSNDIQSTPLGSLPGVVILANSIVGYAAVVDAPPPPWIVERICALALGLLFIAAALVFRSLFAGLVIVATGLAAFMLMSFFLDDSTTIAVVRAALSLLAVFLVVELLFQLAIDIYNRRSWRVVFKPVEHAASPAKPEDR